MLAPLQRWLLIALLLAPTVAFAGKYNAKLTIGEPAPEWKDLEGVDGKKHSLADLKDKEVIVIAFTCNTCPYAVDYEDRMIALAEKFSKEGKVAVVAINANLVEADLLPAMKQRAEEKKFNFPYLHDATQAVARSFGATRTPEFVVLNKERKVVYIGALDDSSDAAKATKHYIADAVTAALAGKTPAITETPPVGCAVRYTRQRAK